MQKISVDLLEPAIAFDRSFQKCIGSCHAYLALREDYREHLRKIQKEIGFKYIRFHGVLCDGVGIYNEDQEGKPYFNFQNLDKIYDFLLDNDIKPFVEFGFMPELLANGSQYCFKYKGYISPPKDYGKWNSLINAFVRHCIERYGLEEVITWRFEVWNEPNLDYFWAGSMEDYFALYRNTADTIKRIDKRLKVGGPATAGNAWIQEIIDFCAKENTPLDFISSHHYSADAVLDLNGNKTAVFTPQNLFTKTIKENTVDKVRNSIFNKAEIHYTEWNATPVHEDVYGKDSEFNPVFVLQTIKDAAGLLDSFSYWTFSDIFEESGPGLTPFSGKYGLLNLHGIKKPVYHAFKFLSDMYDNEIPTYADSVRITKSLYGEYKILTWNMPEVETSDLTGGEWKLKEKKYDEVIRLKNINGTYRVKGYLVNRDNGNSFRKWQEMGSPQYLGKYDIEALKKVSEPLCFVDKIETCEGALDLCHTLSECSFIYYTIETV